METNQIKGFINKVERIPGLQHKLELCDIDLLKVANQVDFNITHKDAKDTDGK